MSALFDVLNVVEGALHESALEWLEETTSLVNGPDHGLLAQLRDFIKEHLEFSLAPKTLSTDISDQIPTSLRTRLKLIPLEVPVNAPPILSISKKELSVAVEVG